MWFARGFALVLLDASSLVHRQVTGIWNCENEVTKIADPIQIILLCRCRRRHNPFHILHSTTNTFVIRCSMFFFFFFRPLSIDMHIISVSWAGAAAFSVTIHKRVEMPRENACGFCVLFNYGEQKENFQPKKYCFIHPLWQTSDYISAEGDRKKLSSFKYSSLAACSTAHRRWLYLSFSSFAWHSAALSPPFVLSVSHSCVRRWILYILYCI